MTSVYEAMFREADDAIFLVDAEQTGGEYEFTFKQNNTAHQQQTGLTEDAMFGKTPRELLGEEQGAAVEANYRRCVERGTTIEYEERLDFPGGTTDWQTKLTPVTDDEAVTQIVGIARDVTEQKEREREHQRTYRRFQTVLETMSAAVFLKDADGRYLLMNQACRDVFDVDVDPIGMTDEELFPEAVAARARADDRRVVEDGEQIEIEETIPTPAGESVRLTRKSPVYDEEGTIRGVCGVSTDITEQRERERALQQLKDRIELAVEGAQIGVWDWDMTTDEVEFNDQWAAMLGHSLDEIDPHLDAWERRVHPDDTESVEAALSEHVAGETEYYDAEHRMRTASGEWKWIRDIGKVVERDGDGEPVRAVGIHLDIDEQKRREKELIRTRRLIERTQQSASMGWWEVDLVDESVTWSDEVYRIHEMPTDEPIDLEAGLDFYHPDDRDTIERAFTRVTEAGESYDLELRILTASGGTRWVRTVGDPQYDENGEVVGVLGLFQDITDRKEREQTLEETKQRLTVALDGTRTGVWEWDLATDEVIWTESMERLFGLEPETFEGTYEAFAEHVHPDDLPALERAIERAKAADEPLKTEYRIRTADGEQLWGEVRAELVESEDGSRRLVGVLSEITSRKEYEIALEATREELRKIIDLVPDLVFVKNRDGEYLLANEATAEAYGKTPAEVEGCSEADIIPDVEDSVEFRQDDLEVIESGEPRSIGEETLTTADGETRVLQTTKIPYKVPETGEDAVLGYARDVTELKEYERTLEEQRDSLKLLNQVVRHDIRNQLMVVESYTELLEGSLPDDQSRTYARTVIEAAKQAAEITETAKDVTDVLLQVGSDRSPVGLRTVLTEQISQIRSDQDRATVSVDGDVPDVTVLADDLLESVFRNLLTNAVVHNDKDAAEIAVSTRAADDSVRVSIADNGPGIADDHKKQIFQEGEKSLESGGTGVGLYLVKTLVDKYGGDVWVEDNEPTGSVFVVELLLAD
ncbi:signal-transducing histidine kinase [Halorubrum kocurii JCM 14978]|uniref:histidine kinase n=1 Tax=Halorubrum kocurii JCM 14978 TaxID=1230456 RepID=M0NXP3_9EURY|nr:signal-transducing histidine kinase [Halorubrum kocurii JCM 14978]